MSCLPLGKAASLWQVLVGSSSCRYLTTARFCLLRVMSLWDQWWRSNWSLDMVLSRIMQTLYPSLLCRSDLSLSNSIVGRAHSKHRAWSRSLRRSRHRSQKQWYLLR